MSAEARVTALELAIKTVALDGRFPPARAGEITAVAQMYYRWLEGPAVLILTAGPLTFDQAAPEGPGMPTIMKGSAVQLTDTQQVTLSVAEADSKGQPVTGDTLAWTVDNPGVVAITPSADGYSCLCVAGTDGTATVTVTDSSVTPPLAGSEAFTVVSGVAASLVLNAGTPEAQPPAAPASSSSSTGTSSSSATGTSA
jgi:hypothetical protein